jgi:glutamate-ammonia-ligase adenylyltransferase
MAIREALVVPLDSETLAREVVAMRRKLEESRGPNDLKRGFGGLADIEFLVQFLQLRHADHPEVARTNLWEALDSLLEAGYLAPDAHHDLREAYDFVRTVEGRLRIVHNRAAVDWPGRPDELARLARRLNYDPPAPPDAVLAFQADAARLASRTRALFEEYVV